MVDTPIVGLKTEPTSLASLACPTLWVVKPSFSIIFWYKKSYFWHGVNIVLTMVKLRPCPQIDASSLNNVHMFSWLKYCVCWIFMGISSWILKLDYFRNANYTQSTWLHSWWSSNFCFGFNQSSYIGTNCTSLEPSWLNWLITGVIWSKFMVDINGTSSHVFMGSKLNRHTSHWTPPCFSSPPWITMKIIMFIGSNTR